MEGELELGPHPEVSGVTLPQSPPPEQTTPGPGVVRSWAGRRGEAGSDQSLTAYLASPTKEPAVLKGLAASSSGAPSG